MIKKMISNVSAKNIGLAKCVKELIIVDLGLARIKEVAQINLR
jgi:hypothetical protein